MSRPVMGQSSDETMYARPLAIRATVLLLYDLSES